MTDIITSLEKISKAEKIKLSKDVLEYIANQSDGSLRDAINFLNRPFQPLAIKPLWNNFIRYFRKGYDN